MTLRGNARAYPSLLNIRAAVGAAGIVVSGLTASASAQNCENVYEPIVYEASSGVLPSEATPPWLAGCGSADWIPGELKGGLLHVLDASNGNTDPPNGLRAAFCRMDIFDCASQDAVYEVVVRTAPGADSTPPHNIDIVLLCGLRDSERFMVIAITEDAVGFITSSGPVDWLVDGNITAKYELDTTDGLHTYRVEKHGQHRVKLFVDGELRLDWNYDHIAPANGDARVMLAVTSSPGVSEFWLQSGRYRIGSTRFDDLPSDCDADLDGDDVVGVTDLLILLGSWGLCEGCPADIDNDGMVGVGDLLILLGLWGPLEGCGDDGGGGDGGIIVTGNACDPNIPPGAYQVVDLGNNHFDVYLLDLYAPYDYSFFEIHPTSGGEIIDHLYIDVAGPPAGSPVVVRVLPSCDNPDLKIDTVYNILETADGEHLLNRVEVDGDVGLVMVEAIGDILLGGDVIGDIIATTPDNAARGITKVKADGNIFGDIRAPFGRIAFVSADGDIGTPESPILIEAKHYIRHITRANNLYAYINGHVNNGTGTISKIIVDRFVGSLDVRKMSTQPSGGELRFNVQLDAIITFGESFSGANRKIEVPVGGLTTQIIFNADNIPDAVWNAPVKIGFDGDPDQVILTGPGYTNTAESLGGGSVGLAPFDLHDESCVPANGDMVLPKDADPDLQVILRHYGPITLNANAPLTIERRTACTNDLFVLLSSTDFVYAVDPADGNSLLVSGAPGTDGFEIGYEYRLIATADLMCDQVTGNPAVSWDSSDYRVTVSAGCPGDSDGSRDGGGLLEDKNGPIRGRLNRK